MGAVLHVVMPCSHSLHTNRDGTVQHNAVTTSGTSASCSGTEASPIACRCTLFLHWEDLLCLGPESFAGDNTLFFISFLNLWTEGLAAGQSVYKDLPLDGIWLDMNEISGYCTGDVCIDPGAPSPVIVPPICVPSLIWLFAFGRTGTCVLRVVEVKARCARPLLKVLGCA